MSETKQKATKQEALHALAQAAMVDKWLTNYKSIIGEDEEQGSSITVQELSGKLGVPPTHCAKFVKAFSEEISPIAPKRRHFKQGSKRVRRVAFKMLGAVDRKALDQTTHRRTTKVDADALFTLQLRQLLFEQAAACSIPADRDQARKALDLQKAIDEFTSTIYSREPTFPREVTLSSALRLQGDQFNEALLRITTENFDWRAQRPNILRQEMHDSALQSDVPMYPSN